MISQLLPVTPTPPLAVLLERLYRLEPRGVELGLERMAAACERFGRPQESFASVHIAGTNGKGSVAAMVAAIGRAAGLRVGLYTSPHLCRFAERIQIDDDPASDHLLAEALEAVLDRAPELTFFESVTLAAFIVFARARVDLGVIEVGLGGRLDATNVLSRPRATAVTRIALDHTDRLGPDIASIAREKAGIIKPGVPVVLGPLSPTARDVVEDRARALGAPVVDAMVDRSAAAVIAAHPPVLAGPHQRENALIAVGLARIASMEERYFSVGLSRVRWPGRLESLSLAEGEVLLDSAHNPDGVDALSRALDERGAEPSTTALVFGVMADKDHGAMLATLSRHARHRIFVRPGGRRAADPADLARRFDGTAAGSVAEALSRARAAVGSRGLVLVAGSIFLVGEARAWLLGLPRDLPIAL